VGKPYVPLTGSITTESIAPLCEGTASPPRCHPATWHLSQSGKDKPDSDSTGQIVLPIAKERRG